MNLQLLQEQEQEELQSVSVTQWKPSAFQITLVASLLLHGGLFALAYNALPPPLPRLYTEPPLGIVLNRFISG